MLRKHEIIIQSISSPSTHFSLNFNSAWDESAAERARSPIHICFAGRAEGALPVTRDAGPEVTAQSHRSKRRGRRLHPRGIMALIKLSYYGEGGGMRSRSLPDYGFVAPDLTRSRSCLMFSYTQELVGDNVNKITNDCYWNGFYWVVVKDEICNL